jgi:DNA-binding GntR family transcriptional regulator
VRNRMMTSFSEHGAIVDAILSGDADGARARLRDHVIVQGDRFSDLVASINSMTRDQERRPFSARR